MKEIRILLADDSETDRQQVQKAFSQVDGCTLVGMVASNNEATQLVKDLQPDIVVLDLPMSHRDGIQVLREIRKEGPLAEIIMFTADPSVVLKEVCLEAGADFYLHKSQIQDLLDICSGRLTQH